DVRHARDRARITELEEALPALEADVERAAAMGLVAASLHSRRTELEVRVAAATERRTVQSRRLEEIEVRLEPRPPSVIPQQLTALAALATHLGSVSAEVEATLGRLQAERREALATASALGEQLDDLRRSRAAAERELTETRELLQRASLEEAELRVRIETTTESCRRDLDCEPEAAMAAVCPELPPGTTADHRARELERDLRLMGPINPLALEEHAALLERHGFLEAQLEDVKAGRRELAKVIRATDTEI